MNKQLFNFLSEDEILIGAWVSPPPKNTVDAYKSFITDEQYKFLKESGINTIYGLYERGDILVDNVYEALRLAEKYGLNYLVRDEGLRLVQTVEEYNDFLNKYLNYKSFAGFLFWDEPGIIDFKQIKQIQDIASRSNHPEKLVYVNLLPRYANENQFWSGAIELEKAPKSISSQTYYQIFVDQVKPQYISYDFYPFEGKFPEIKDGFYEQYSEVNKVAIENNIPVLCFIQLVSFNEATRIPTLEEIMFQVNTSLVYNVKGIQYFTYFLPVNEKIEKFKGAMINHKGERTEVYKIVQQVNQYIELVQSILKHAEWQGIVSSNKSEIPISDRIDIDEIDINQENIIIGVFKTDNSRCLYVVNTLLTDISECTMLFKAKTKITTFNQNELKQESLYVDKPINISLLPGEARLIIIHNN